MTIASNGREGMRWARRLLAAARVAPPLLLGSPRSAATVAAFYDLVTKGSRFVYGDSFHFGYFPDGEMTLAEALEAHTDLVAGLLAPRAGERVLDVGCGVGAPAVRIAKRCGCSIMGVNVSVVQVAQAQALVANSGLSGRVTVTLADARELPFPDESFDAALCLEAASDICVRPGDRGRLLAELARVLRPGGRVGFSDLALRATPTRAEGRALRPFLLYHSAADLVCDWPALFSRHGFEILEQRDILLATQPTWRHVIAHYRRRREHAVHPLVRRAADAAVARLERIPDILSRYGRFPVLVAQKPLQAAGAY